MRVVPCVLVIAWLSVTGTGCSLFNKRSKDGERTAGPGAAKEPAKFPASNGDPIRGGTASTADYNGLIAGTIIDRYNNRPKEAFIYLVSLDEGKKEGAPIDVAANPDGYFTIRGVQPNRHYKLIARAKNGDRLMAGVTYVKAPDIHVLIKLSEDMVTADTPPIPGAPTYNPKAESPKKSSAQPVERPASAQVPAWNPGSPASASNNNVVPDLPSPVSVPAPATNANPVPASWVPGVVAIPGPKGQVENPTPLPPVPVPLPGTTSTRPTRVPSCVRIGNQLINFALYDLNHQPWEYRRQHTGKLVLLDFWYTSCIPCKHTIPNLVSLQNQYGRAGLEIIGIAYESGSFQEQSRRVASIAQRLQANYRLLLGSGDNCPVRTEFRIRAFPTLVLLDENGVIVWRHEGTLDRESLEELDLLLRRRLGV